MVNDYNYDPQRTLNNLKSVLTTIAFLFFVYSVNSYMEYIRNMPLHKAIFEMDRFHFSYVAQILFSLIVLLYLGNSFLPEERRIRLNFGK